jgi:predicted HTH transcriptional regulator
MFVTVIRLSPLTVISNRDVKKHHDRFVFENPGLFRIPVKDAIRGGLSDPRNLAMMSIFNLVNVGEKQGGGIPLMFETAKGEGFPEPMVETRSDLGRTTITLFVSKPSTTQNTTQNTTQKNTSNMEKAFLLLKENPTMTRAEMASRLGITPDGANFIIDSLKAKGRIKR